MTQFYAHSLPGRPKNEWEGNAEHATSVGLGTAARAMKFGAADFGFAVGVRHDFGKFDPDFQPRLEGAPVRFDHSIHGALHAELSKTMHGRLAAYCVAGHHSGLADGTRSADTPGRVTPLDERMGRPTDLRRAVQNAEMDGFTLPTELPLPGPLKISGRRKGYSTAFFTRMVFSCLVDADSTSTAAFYARAEGRTMEHPVRPSLADLRDGLMRHLGKLEEKAGDVPSPVNLVRREILRSAITAAAMDAGLFTLTVPTGGGKTLSSIAFALEHALSKGLDRVIVVIPFTSVVEQTAKEFREAFATVRGGPEAVLEHHSSFDVGLVGDEEHRRRIAMAAENWDAPIVVTTAVQFLESLHSNQRSRCRKLHNVARSVVIIDEAQTLPLDLLKPSVAAINELAKNYGTSVVLSTATPPSITVSPTSEGVLIAALENPREIAPPARDLFPRLKRVRIVYEGKIDDAGLSKRLRDEESVLCILNTRRHAREVYGLVEGESGAFHLSTSMCAEHRSRTLDAIKRRLADRTPCRVVSTSLIEAGVNVDFRCVLRAEAGLDQIAQAAGRANREGLGNDLATVSVFAVDRSNVLRSMAPQVDACREVMRLASLGRFGGDVLSPEAIGAFFGLLYRNRGKDSLDARGILPMLEKGFDSWSYPFETVASLFRIIDEGGAPLVVPGFGAEAILDEIRGGADPTAAARALQRHVVSVPEATRQALIASGAAVVVDGTRCGDQFVALSDATLYSAATGFVG